MALLYWFMFGGVVLLAAGVIAMRIVTRQAHAALADARGLVDSIDAAGGERGKRQ